MVLCVREWGRCSVCRKVAVLDVLYFIPEDLRSMLRHREVISFCHLTVRVSHLVAEQVHRCILFGEASAVGMAEIVVFEINI